jgi:hypothetical protein
MVVARRRPVSNQYILQHRIHIVCFPNLSGCLEANQLAFIDRCGPGKMHHSWVLDLEVEPNVVRVELDTQTECFIPE